MTKTMNKLRVAYLNLNSGPHGEYGVSLASAVAAQPNVEVLLIAPKKVMQTLGTDVCLNQLNKQIVEIDGLARKAPGLFHTWRALREFKPAIIHDPVGSGTATTLPLRPFLPLIAPVVVTEHNPDVHSGMSGWHHGFARSVSRHFTNLFHVHGPKAYSDMCAKGVSSKRLVTVRLGAFDAYGEAAQKFQRGHSKQILVFGELRPNKGIDMLPEIFTLVRKFHPDATMLVAGKRYNNIDKQMGASMDRALHELSHTEGCTVLNARIPDEKVPELFGKCGVCLLPYHSATQSAVATIAMTTKAPIVATNVGDLPDVIEDGKTGMLSSPESSAIADKIIEMFDKPELSRKLANSASKFASEECAWPVIGDRLVSAYHSMLKVSEQQAS